MMLEKKKILWKSYLEKFLKIFFSFICLFIKTVLYDIYRNGARVTISRDAGIIIYPLAGNMMARG
jgi:hypothetical protein